MVWSGQKEQALDVLRRLHHTADDPEDRLAHAEHAQIVLQVEFEQELKASWIQIFKKPSLRRRAILSMFLLYVSGWHELDDGS